MQNILGYDRIESSRPLNQDGIIKQKLAIKDYPDQTIYGASFSFCLDSWEKPRDFVLIRKLVSHEDNGKGMLFPKWQYQVICQNQLDMSHKEVWEHYNQWARIELNVRDLDYEHFITKVPTGEVLKQLCLLLVLCAVL
jgi:hypothetical protein